MKKISIQEGANLEFDRDSKRPKEEKVLDFLITFREYLLENKIAEIGDIMPSKDDIAKFLKVSTGTVQNAIKYAEDMGYFTSKQCIGTILSEPAFKKNGIKMFSKKDKTTLEIKKYLKNHSYEENEIIPGISELSNEFKTSANTVRLALFELVQEGILKKEIYKKNVCYILISKIKLTEKEKNTPLDIKNKNLVKILKENIKKYLTQNFKSGDKIPTNKYFSEIFNVSIRTVNSAMKELNREKIVLSRRGNYGSIFLNTSYKEAKSEKSKFMSKPKGKMEFKNSYNYKWESAYDSIKSYILKNYEAGDKILTIKGFAQKLNTSTTTVKRAIKELSNQGILYAQKGKYGGLFIVEMPQRDDLYTWLAINPEYFE